MEENLWGTIFDNSQNLIIAPKKILEEQADEFNKRSQQLGIICTITHSFEEQIASWKELGIPFGEPEQKEKYLVLKMQLSVPELDNYTFVVLSVKYFVSKIYPSQIKNLISDGSWETVQSEDEFRGRLKAILSSKEMRQLLINLKSQLFD